MGWKKTFLKTIRKEEGNRSSKNHPHWVNAGGIRKIFQAHKVLQSPTHQCIMKITSWNIKGLNSLGKYRLIKNMIQEEKSQVFFMQETKCNSTTLDQTLAKAWSGSKAVVIDP